MTLTGHIHNGSVVFDGNPVLPEGATVSVTFPIPTPVSAAGHRIQLPLVRTARPGSLKLTSERIAEILEEDDVVSSRR